MEFPANSKVTPAKKTAAKTEKPEIKPVVQPDEVSEKKPGLGRRFKDIFLGADFKGASQYIVADVLFPAVRNMIVDATTKGIERFVYGDTSPRGRPTNHRPRTTYQTPVSRGRTAMLPDQPPRRVPVQQATSNDVILSSMDTANAVLETLREYLDKYEVVSVADLRAHVGLPSTYVDNNWGWYDLSYAGILQTREGYLLDLPNAEPLT